MAITKCVKGSGEWWVDVRYNGRRTRRRSPVQTRRGAEAYERQLIAEFQQDTTEGRDPFAGPAPTLREFSVRWMHDYVESNNRASVRHDKNGVLRRHILPALGSHRLDAISVADIDAFMAAKRREGLKAKTVNNIASVLHTCLTKAVDWGLLRVVPRHHWLRVSEQKFRYLTDIETRSLLDVVPDGFWRTFIIFLLHEGVRFSEAAALQWEDIDADRTTPIVRIRRGGARGCPGETKTGSHRDLPLTTAVVELLARLPRTNELVFPTPRGRMMDPASKTSYLHRFCRRADLRPFGWHVFRHTYATRMAAAGTPVHILQRLMGHTTIKMTMRYVHVDNETLASMAATVQRAIPIPNRDGHYSGTQPSAQLPQT